MHWNTGLLIDATRKASRFLHRDYFELENLQSSSKSTESFCNKSVLKSMENLQETLSRYYKTIIFTGQDIAKFLELSSLIALIEPLDGIKNLQRSLPFFAIMITILSRKNINWIAEKCIINFPAINEIYYAEKGKGAWLERHSSNFSGAMRIRVSGTRTLDNIVIASENDTLSRANMISDNYRNYGSYLYSATLLCSGKIDLCLFTKKDISFKGLELLVIESGGRSFIKNDLFVGTNYYLSDKINNLIK